MKYPWDITIVFTEQAPLPKILHQTFKPTEEYWRQMELHPKEFENALSLEVGYMIKNLLKEIKKAGK